MSSVIEIVGETFHEWSEDKASRLSAALAYYTVFSIPPLLVVAIGIASMFTDRATIEEQVVGQAGGLMGQQGAEGIRTILQSAEQPGNGELLPTLFGLALLLFGAAGSIILLLLWVYYSAQIIFLGAEFTEVYARVLGSGVKPKEDAVAITKEARAQQGIPTEGEVERRAQAQSSPNRP